MNVFVLTNQTPDYSARLGAPLSVHKTLTGAKRAYANGKYMDSWRKADSNTWNGPDGFGSILKFTVQD